MEKRGLGRGLASLISETASSNGVEVQFIPVEQVVPNPYQPRTTFDPLKMEELVASIREHGVLQPVLLRRVGHERYELVAGERRFRAARDAGLSTISALVKECSERELLEMALVENVQREDIGPVEAARAYRQLIDAFGLTQEGVAGRVGKSRPAVANALRLLSLPEPVQQSLERAEITEGHARALLALEAPEAIRQAWEEVVRNRLSVRDTERLARRRKTAAPAEPSSSDEEAQGRLADPPDPHVAAVLDTLQQALGTRVELRRGAGGQGKIEIYFYSDEELERLVDLLPGGRETP